MSDNAHTPSSAAPPPDPTTAGHDDRANPPRGRFNSWFLNLLDGYVDTRTSRMRDEICNAGEDAKEVVEIGPGNGPLFHRLSAGTRVHAIEPDPYFHERLKASARRHGIELCLHQCGAQEMDLSDDSVDAIIGTWVLCTVTDPQRVLSEVARVLRPGGQFAFYEHVAAPPAASFVWCRRPCTGRGHGRSRGAKPTATPAR
ncbi:MAG: class I SAM-dependent methyltransferase [Ornithinimicrobium sp.]